MDELLQKLISIDSIPGETAEQQADRLSIEKNLDSASMRYKLSQIYASTLGDAASMENVVNTLQSMVENPTKTKDSKDETIKADDGIQERVEKKMAEQNNNPFSGLAPDANLKGTESLNNLGAGKAAPNAKPAGELSDAMLESLSEAGISVEEVKALFANKDKLRNLGGGDVKVEKYFAVKEPARVRLSEYKGDNVSEAYSLGQTVSGTVGYIVKPSMKGDINSEKFAERIATIRADIVKATGYNNGEVATSKTKTNPQHVKNLINILDSAANLGDNETPETYKGIVPDDKLSNHPGKILVGNNIFLADVEAASNTWSYKAVKLSDADAKEDVSGNKYDQLSFPAAGSYLKSKGISMVFAKDGKSAIALKQGKKTINKVEQLIDTISIDGKKDIDRAMREVVAKTANQKIGYIRVDAKLLQPITYITQNSKNKDVTKKLKIKVYAKVYNDYKLKATNLNPCLSVAKEKSSTGTGRATSSMLSDFSSGNISLETVAKFMKRMKKQGINYAG